MEPQPVAGASAPSTCAECGAEITSTRKNATGSVEFAEPCGHRVGEQGRPLALDLARRPMGGRLAAMALALSAHQEQHPESRVLVVDDAGGPPLPPEPEPVVAPPPVQFGLTYKALADLCLAAERRCPRGHRPSLVIAIKGHHLTRKVQLVDGLRGKNLGWRGDAGTEAAHTLVRLHVDETKRWLRKNARHLLAGHEVLR